MARPDKFKPEDIAHIIKGSKHGLETLECSICKDRYKPHLSSIQRNGWIQKHIQCNKEPRYSEIIECPIPEARGIGHAQDERASPRTDHILDREVRHFPYERDERDYGQREAKKTQKRRSRQWDKAFCDEWTPKEKEGEE